MSSQFEQHNEPKIQVFSANGKIAFECTPEKAVAYLKDGRAIKKCSSLP